MFRSFWTNQCAESEDTEIWHAIKSTFESSSLFGMDHDFSTSCKVCTSRIDLFSDPGRQLVSKILISEMQAINCEKLLEEPYQPINQFTLSLQ